MTKLDKEYIKTKFVEYAAVDTQSVDGATEVPSSKGQIELGTIIVGDLKKLGVSDVEQTANAYVIARVKGNTKAPTIAFIAHLDTYHETSGKNVKPIIHENYNGKDIQLPKDGTMIRLSDYPELKEKTGKTIITSSGDTLLGGDDKAGVAVAMGLVKFLVENKDFKHGDVCFIFTPDEEIGHGAALLDIKKLDAACAYTLDSEGFGTITNETFCANHLTVDIKGKDIHPGYAKNKMVNAVRMAAYFIEKLPLEARPETTEGRTGFLHPIKIEGGVANTKISVLVRSFEVEGLEKLEAVAKKVADETMKKFPGGEINFIIKEQYRNMKYQLDKDPRVIDYALKAMERFGVKPSFSLARGGTDGSRLSFRGLLTPDIPAGFYAYHSKMEWVCLEEMVDCAGAAKELVSVWAE